MVHFLQGLCIVESTIAPDRSCITQDCLSTTKHCFCDVRAESGVKQWCFFHFVAG